MDGISRPQAKGRTALNGLILHPFTLNDETATTSGTAYINGLRTGAGTAQIHTAITKIICINKIFVMIHNKGI